MGTYILVMEMTDKGRTHIHEMSRLLADAKKIILGKGAKVEAIYSVLGRYDFVSMIEAPDTRTMSRVSSLLAATGFFKLETLPAITVEELIEK